MGLWCDGSAVCGWCSCATKTIAFWSRWFQLQHCGQLMSWNANVVRRVVRISCCGTRWPPSWQTIVALSSPWLFRSFQCENEERGREAAEERQAWSSTPPSTMAEYTEELVHILQNPSAVILRNSRNKMMINNVHVRKLVACRDVTAKKNLRTRE